MTDEKIIIDDAYIQKLDNLTNELANEFNSTFGSIDVTIRRHKYAQILATITEMLKVIKQQRQQLDKYEEYGGAIDEGRAWAGLANTYEDALTEIMSYCKYISAFNDANKCNKTDVNTILYIIDKANIK